MFQNLIVDSDLKSYTRPIFSFEYDCQCAWELCCLESTAKMIGWPPCIGFWTLQVLVYNFDCLLCKILCAYINVIFFLRSCKFCKDKKIKRFLKIPQQCFNRGTIVQQITVKAAKGHHKAKLTSSTLALLRHNLSTAQFG